MMTEHAPNKCHREKTPNVKSSIVFAPNVIRKNSYRRQISKHGFDLFQTYMYMYVFMFI